MNLYFFWFLRFWVIRLINSLSLSHICNYISLQVIYLIIIHYRKKETFFLLQLTIHTMHNPLFFFLKENLNKFLFFSRISITFCTHYQNKFTVQHGSQGKCVFHCTFEWYTDIFDTFCDSFRKIIIYFGHSTKSYKYPENRIIDNNFIVEVSLNSTNSTNSNQWGVSCSQNGNWTTFVIISQVAPQLKMRLLGEQITRFIQRYFFLETEKVKKFLIYLHS